MRSFRFSLPGIFLSLTALADAMPYGERQTLKSDSANLTSIHRHDWNSRPRTGYLLIQNKKNRTVKKVPAPALSYLWQSPDGEYIVGLSNIKYENRNQLIVWNKQGRVLLARPVRCKNSDLPIAHCGESGANIVNWHHESDPGIRMERESERLSLYIRQAKRIECYRLDLERLQSEDPDWLEELNCDQKPGEIRFKLPAK